MKKNGRKKGLAWLKSIVYRSDAATTRASDAVCSMTTRRSYGDCRVTTDMVCDIGRMVLRLTHTLFPTHDEDRWLPLLTYCGFLNQVPSSYRAHAECEGPVTLSAEIPIGGMSRMAVRRLVKTLDAQAKELIERYGAGLFRVLQGADPSETMLEIYKGEAVGVSDKEKGDEADAKPSAAGSGSGDGRRSQEAYSLDGLNVKGKFSPHQVVVAARNFLDDKYRSADEDRPRMNILLFGPPGTGKTEFVRYLGRELGLPVKVVKGSDVLSKYIGESESKIADAFSQAEADGAILFFDEVDGLVRSRKGADHSWEVTQVNELLQQMEGFGGIMVAATNSRRDLDPAAMRRFTYKIEFDYLDNDGKKVFFERYFKYEPKGEALAGLASIANLTPGDFRTVRQEQYYLGECVSDMERVSALAEECALKEDGSRMSAIGF